MKALILVGGYGTRLRPLTLSVPKPLIHFCNKSIIEHQIEALVKAGVDHVILAVAYQPAAMIDALKSFETKFNIRISCSCEQEPLGTAGPIRLAEPLLCDGKDTSDSFFVLNSDITCDFPLNEMLEFHNSHQKEGTILVTQVKDPSKFGVVVSNGEGRVERFVEKPTVLVGDHINAGLYIIRKSVIQTIEARPTSIEREVFPVLASQGKLYSFRLKGYWADIGQPADFLHGMELYLKQLKQSQSAQSSEEAQNNHVLAEAATQQDSLRVLCNAPFVRGNVLVHPTAKIGNGCVLGPDVTIGAGCVIGDGVRLVRTAVMEGVTIEAHTYVINSILGWKAKLGQWVRVEGLTVVGENVTIANECFINQALILPHKEISQSIFEEKKIIM